MIVRRGSGVLHLITQPDHAALARRIMEHWKSLAQAERRDDILLAVEQHDNGWQEPDRALTVDPATATVLDFVHVAADVRQGVWPRAVDRLAHAPWAAALVAHHALTVYDRYRADEAWREFFPAMAALRDRYVAAAGLAMKPLVRDYVYVRMGDLLSLVFCTAAPEPQTLGPWTIRLEGARLLVQPSPFADDVAFSVDAREIPDVGYATNQVLRAAVAAATVRVLEGVVASQPVH
jgi:hypothetical protein